MRARGPAPTPPRAAWREWRRSTYALVGHARQLLGNESQRTDHLATLAWPADPEREGIEDTNELNSGAAHEVVGNLDRLGKGLQSRQIGRSAAVVLQACPPPIKVVQPGRHIEAAGIDAETGLPKLGLSVCLPLCFQGPSAQAHFRKKYSGRHLRPVVGTRIPVKLSTGTHEAQRPEMLRCNETTKNVGISE
jgi:hypothetical protein